MTQPVFSPSQWGVQKAEQFFKVQEDDKMAVKGLKVAGRALTNTALAAAALAETVVFAALTVVLSVTYFVHHNTFASLKERTTVAANTVKDAFKGIGGYYDSAKAAEAKAAAEAKTEHVTKFAPVAEEEAKKAEAQVEARADKAEAKLAKVKRQRDEAWTALDNLDTWKGALANLAGRA